MDGVVEIITGRERRRRWSTAEKLRLVAETHEAGAAIRAVATRHGVCESLLFTWRRQVREGVLTAASETPVFMPVRMIDAAPTATPGPSPAAANAASPARPPAPSGLIEIELGNGRQVRVGSDVNLAALRRVLAALRE
ncbi:IS66-like element accessory protein TnpA [Limobrevibacterium gyesilva]|uniref:Transposase n=1 Tax=Limobrevibacterium gyesilva TaxID=2991712 RepID=A0AA41YVT3_9PROT|nr:transposase [Limobrevibacterium gyesilva]MCW3476307.1 transposase [Limobrevibacterium gyesilva]